MELFAEAHWAIINPILSISAKRYRYLLFSVLWLAYGSTYLLRKPIGVIKGDLAQEFQLSRLQLGLLDAALLFPYAFMQLALGPLADRFGPRRTLTLCLLVSGLSMATFGLWNSYIIWLLLLATNGTALAVSWPSCSKTLAAWLAHSGNKVSHTIFGIFGLSAFVGGVAGTGLAVGLQVAYGWRHVHLCPSLLVIVLALLVYVFVRTPAERNAFDNTPMYQDTVQEVCPERVPLHQPDSAALAEDPVPVAKRLSRWRAWLDLWSIPLIPEITFTVFCIKVVRYCMYMWLPLYLLDSLHYGRAQAGLMSTAFEIGGGFGTALIGVIVSRLFGGRTLLAIWILILLSAISLLSFLLTAQWGVVGNVLFLFLAGVTNCGPDTLLCGAIPARLGEKDGRDAGAALSGLVNGAGSMGTFLEGPLIGLAAQHWGWGGVFLIMVLLTAAGAVAVFRAMLIQRSMDKQGIPNGL